MGILLPVITTGNPKLNTLETAVISGNLHKLYLLQECTNYVLNGGANNTTDWVDSNSDGLADDWVLSGAYTICSILTGSISGFTGNAQKFVCGGISSPNDIYIFEHSFQLDADYNLSFKYKSNIQIDIMNGGYEILYTLAASPTNVTSTGNILINTNDYIFFSMHDVAQIGDWVILDEVSVC
jgi:hypothetical protein